MRIWRRPGTPSETELVGLADGSLRGQRRAEVERALEDRPDLRAAVAAQRHVLEAIKHASAQPAPHALRARLALAHPPARPRAQRRTLGLAAAGTGLAAAAAGIVVAVTGGTAVAQASVLQAAAVSNRVSEQTVDQPPIGSNSLPGVAGGGLSYPYWQDHFGFVATGVRYDRIGGQAVTTVFYQRGSSRVAYEIVSGPTLRLGGAAGRTVRGGLVLRTLNSPRGQVVTWTRDGHTCVLVGDHTALPVLLKLASWRKGGRIPY